MKNQFVKEYPADELDFILDLHDIAYDNFPLPIVSSLKNYEQCIEGDNYQSAYRCLLDFFELSIQYCSGLLISQLIHSEIVFDDELKAILGKIVEKPLSFGDWVNSIFLVLVAKSKSLLPDNQLANHLWEGLINQRKGNILEGWQKVGDEYKGIVYFRNNFSHDSYRSDDLLKIELGYLEPRIWALLSMLQPLANYNFFMIEQVIDAEGDEKTYTIIQDPVKSNEGIRISSDILLDESAYFMTEQKIRRRAFIEGRTIIKLSPFVIYYQNNEVHVDEKFQYIFQTLNEKNLKKMTFVSADKNARRMETELFKESFWSLLERIFGRLIKHDKFKISFNREKTLSEYQERLQTETNSFLNQQFNSDKYDPNVFLDRVYLSDTYNDFLRSNCAAYIILGDAGAGKTNQICYWASSLRPNCLCLAFYSKNFTKKTLQEQLQLTFNDSKKSALQLLEEFELVLEKSDTLACIFFDAINECNTYKGGEQGEGAVDLLTEINNLFVQGKFKRFKLILSCRTYTWEEVLNKDILQLDRYYTIADDRQDHVTLKGFSEEEFNEVYPKYLEKYSLTTTLNRLLEDRYDFVRRRLLDPLILKTASQNFKGREFPNDLRQFNSTKLFSQRLEELKKKPKGFLQTNILEDFTAILWNDFKDSIPLGVLHRAYEEEEHPLYKFSRSVFKDESLRHKDTFISLLEEGILRIEKGINKEIRFVYERFNEYMFARHFLYSNAGSGNRKVPISASAYEHILRISGHSTVVIAALRNALIMDFYEKSKDPATLVSLSLSPLYEAQPLVEETLAVMIDENYLDVFGILEYMLNFEKEESKELIKKREQLEQVLEKAKVKSRISISGIQAVGAQKQKVDDQIIRILKIRKIAISVIYKIYKSDNLDLLIDNDRTDPNKLVWIAMGDPLPEVRDNASIYIYYVARYNTTIGLRIITAMSDKVIQTPLASLLSSSARKELQQSYIEPACRVGLFLLIDGLIERGDYDLAIHIQNTWKSVVSKFTLNHVLIRMAMPFFKLLMARQTVVQKEYVNNGIEYKHFWDAIPIKAEYPDWSQEGYRFFVPYFDPSIPDFKKHEQLFINGYLTGDSYSLFVLERVLIVQGLADWNNISNIVHYLSHLPESKPLKDYIEMSVIYALYQINLKSDKILPIPERIFGEMAKKWSMRKKGFYYAHYNDKANAGKPYKQFVLNWYASVYCHSYGDGAVKPGDTFSAPDIRELIEYAYRKKDKALLYNCIENIAMIVPTSGYYKTALQLFEYLISLFKNESEILEFDNIVLDGKHFEKGLRSFICDMLGTVKSYYPKEVDYFIVNKLKAYQFPDLDAFREEIFNHSLSNEGIGDLLTHKFGNFYIWSILNDKDIRRFFIQICNFGPDSNSYIEYFDTCIRYCFQEVFGVKNLSN